VSWLDELEAQLDQRLGAFLQGNPAQEALLAEQEARDRQARLAGQRRQLQRQAEQQRQALLQLADEIRQWQQRVTKARAAGADQLADRAQAHQGALMDQGRQRWQQLGELGVSFAAVEEELQQLANQPVKSPVQRASNLEKDWAAFETQQALDDLKRRPN
jgi:hercynine metabolism protein